MENLNLVLLGLFIFFLPTLYFLWKTITFLMPSADHLLKTGKKEWYKGFHWGYLVQCILVLLVSGLLYFTLVTSSIGRIDEPVSVIKLINVILINGFFYFIIKRLEPFRFKDILLYHTKNKQLVWFQREEGLVPKTNNERPIVNNHTFITNTNNSSHTYKLTNSITENNILKIRETTINDNRIDNRIDNSVTNNYINGEELKNNLPFKVKKELPEKHKEFDYAKEKFGLTEDSLQSFNVMIRGCVPKNPLFFNCRYKGKIHKSKIARFFLFYFDLYQPRNKKEKWVYSPSDLRRFIKEHTYFNNLEDRSLNGEIDVFRQILSKVAREQR